MYFLTIFGDQIGIYFPIKSWNLDFDQAAGYIRRRLIEAEL